MGLSVMHWLRCGSCNNAVVTCAYMQGLSKAAVDALVINATRKPQSVEKAPPGFSSVGCMEYGSMQLMSIVLNVALVSIVTQPDWHYLGCHALPICMPMFVASANRLLFNSGSPDDEELLQKNAQMRSFFDVLCESLQAACSHAAMFKNHDMPELLPCRFCPVRHWLDLCLPAGVLCLLLATPSIAAYPFQTSCLSRILHTRAQATKRKHRRS